MSDSGSQHSFPDSPSADGSNPYITGNIVIKDQERRPSVVYNCSSNSSPSVLTEKPMSDSIPKQHVSKYAIKETSCVNEILSKAATHCGLSPAQLAKAVAAQSAAETSQAIHQAASRLQQQQPVMAKKSNAFSPFNKDNITSPTGMVQLNLVNENGIVTPIEINASVAAAAAMVAAQKQKNHKLEAAVHNSLISTSINSAIVSSSLGNTSKHADLGTKSSKSSTLDNSLVFNVSYQ